MLPTAESIDVVILTVLPQEYDAVCSQFAQLRPSPSVSGAANLYAWQIGEVPCPRLGGTYIVSIGMMGRAGTPQSALATVDAIQRWQARYVFFVGIAGGLAGLSKGDVVVADVIYGYEYGKVERVFLPRDNWTYKTDLGLLNASQAYALREHWLERIHAQPPSACKPRVTAGEVVSGDKVVDDPTNEFFAEVLKRWPKAKAVEMEGTGVGAAIEQAHALGTSVGFTMIRGISDMPRPPQDQESRGTVERDSWKTYASDTAAAFAVGLIAQGLPELPRLHTTNSNQTTFSISPSPAKSDQVGVFISHRGADVDLAEKLAQEIQQAGFQVWLDEWDIRVGDSIVERMNAGLETAKYVIVCYSEAGVLSSWMSREWFSALARQLNGCDVKVLPVRLSGGTPPAILADIKYADLVKNWSRGVSDLLRAMR